MLSKINRQQNTPNRPIRAVFVVILPLVAAIIALSGCIRHDFRQNFQAVTLDFPVTLTNATITNPAVDALTTTDCSALIPGIWHAAGFYDEPMEKTAAELQQVDGCTSAFLNGPAVRE